MVYRLRYITLARRRNSKISLEANFFFDLLRPTRQQNYINLGESRCMAWTIYKSTTNESTLITTVTLYIRESGLRNLGTFCLFDLESGTIFLVQTRILGFWSRIQLKESGIPLRIGIRNPSSTGKESGLRIWNPRCGIQNPRLFWISWIPLHGVRGDPHGASSYPYGASSYSPGHHTTKESCGRDGRFPVWVDEWWV